LRWIVAGVALAVLVAPALFLFWPGPTTAPTPLPEPNGYHDFVEAGALVGDMPEDYRKLTEGDLRPFVNENAVALKRAREGLRKACRVPVQNSANYLNLRMGEFTGNKRLAKALIVEGRLAECEGHTNGAAQSYLDTIHLGHEIARGGLLIDHLVGLACEGIGRIALTNIVAGLNAQECRAVIARLESIESQRESSKETLRIEQTWSRQSFGLGRRIGAMMAAKSLNPAASVYKSYLSRLQMEIVRQAELRVELATRAYELEQGKPPARASDLVPAYLKTLPVFPATNSSGSHSDFFPR
jgi:hypothetical protein